ncbi:MAG: hypothetical protein V5A88_08690 [Candidatus Thermoplasmatota archaeon]
MPEKGVSISIERMVSISIIFGLVLGSSALVSGIALGSVEHEGHTDAHSMAGETIQQDHIREWTQSSQEDFQEGELDDTLSLDESGNIKLDTYSYTIGKVETPDAEWQDGYTTKTGDPDYQASRGGEINEFTMATGENVSSFDLMVLKPTGNSNEYRVDTPDGEVAIDNPAAGGVRTWDVNLPINQDDWIGIYTFGRLSAAKIGEDFNHYRTDTNIGSTPETMQESSEAKRHTMEANIITHEDQGILESREYDAGEYFWDWGTISWESEVPEGTTDLTIETRTSPDQTSWSDWEEAENEGEVPSPRNRYIQYRVIFEALDGIDTPELNEISISYEVDEEPPEVSHEIVSGTLRDEGWYTGIVGLNITAADDISGVDSILTRTGDSEAWDEYNSDAITLEFDSGVREIEYKARNNQGLESDVESLEIKVDNVDPELDITLPETTRKWYSFSPEITISSGDNLSGLSSMAYRYGQSGDWQTLFEDNVSSQEESIVCEERGEVNLEVRSRDLVGNEMRENVTFFVDTSQPTLQDVSYSETVWNNGMEIRANVNERHSGISQVRLYYDTGDGMKDISMNQEGGEYVARIPSDEIGFSPSLEYYVEAVDHAGNVMESDTNEAEVGINGWYFTPTPVILGLLGLFVYWKKKREKEEELIPMKDSRLSKIQQGKEQKLEEIHEERDQRAPAPEGFPEKAKGGGSSLSAPTGTGGAAGAVGPGGQKDICDICDSDIASENLVTCSCGNVYHEACLRLEGYCPNCGEDYDNIESTPSYQDGYRPPEKQGEVRPTREGVGAPEETEGPKTSEPFESSDTSERQPRQERTDKQSTTPPPDKTGAPERQRSQERTDKRSTTPPPDKTGAPERQPRQERSDTQPPTPPPERTEETRKESRQREQNRPVKEQPRGQDRKDSPKRDEDGKLLSPSEVAERRKTKGKEKERGKKRREERDKEKSSSNKGVITCPYCGSENEPEFEKCWACDADLKRD